MARTGVWMLAAAVGCMMIAGQRLAAFPLDGGQTALPASTELNEDALLKPREAFHSELNRGHKSYLVNLGDLAFNSPDILGGVARQAGMSCGTCHVNGAGNGNVEYIDVYNGGLISLPNVTTDTTGRTYFQADGNGSVLSLSNLTIANGSSSTFEAAGIFNNGRTVLGLMPHLENAVDPLLGGTDGRAFFEGLVGALQ